MSLPALPQDHASGWGPIVRSWLQAAVSTSAQSLTSGQQAQAQSNIGLVAQPSAPQRANLVRNPLGASVKNIYGWVVSRVTAAVQAGYVRCTISDTTATDLAQRITPRTTTWQAVEASTSRQFSADVRSNTGLPMKITVTFYTSGGSSISSVSSATAVPNDTTWTTLSVTATTPATAAAAYVQIGISGTSARTAGQWFDVRNAFVGDGGAYFDGDTGQVAGAVCRWSGRPGDSSSYAGASPSPARLGGVTTEVPSSQGVADALIMIRQPGLSVQMWGARGDGVTDDTAAIQAALDAARPTRSAPAAGISGARLYFPPGEYLISDTLSVYRWAGLIEGAGVGASPSYATSPGNGSVLRWTGASDRPMVKLKDSRHVKISNLRLEGNDASQPTYLIECNNLTADNQGHNSNLVFDGLYLGTFSWSSQGTDKGAAAGGIGWTGDNGNNDQFVVRDCFIRGCGTGLYVPNSQSIWGSIENTTLWGCTIGLRSSASLMGKNVRFQLCGKDVQVDASAQVDIHGWFSEHSGMVAYASSQGRIIARGGQWTLHSDLGVNPFIQHDVAINNGGVFLVGMYIDTALSPFPKIKMTATAASSYLGRLSIRDCRLLMDLSRFDISTSGTSGVEVNLQYGDYNVRGLRLTAGNTLSAAPSTLAGYGLPQSVVTATPGSTFQRLDGGAATSFYVKESGTGNTGWVAK
jgi:hypothetical protein